MGIADAGADMMPQSAAPATQLIARAFTGHLPIVGARPVQARQPRTGVEGSDFLDWPKPQIGKLRVTSSSVVHGIMNPAAIARPSPAACAGSQSLRLLGDGIVYVAASGDAFIKVVPFGLRRSFCETCCRITGHPRRIRFVG